MISLLDRNNENNILSLQRFRNSFLNMFSRRLKNEESVLSWAVSHLPEQLTIMKAILARNITSHRFIIKNMAYHK